MNQPSSELYTQDRDKSGGKEKKSIAGKPDIDRLREKKIEELSSRFGLNRVGELAQALRIPRKVVQYILEKERRKN